MSIIMRTGIFLFLFWSLTEESLSEKFRNPSTVIPPATFESRNDIRDPSTVIPPATFESRNDIRVRKNRNGLLLVSNGGEYGTVCDDNFDVNDARVVCRMLNEPSEGARVLHHARGGWSRKILLDNVTCSGNETSLNECAHAGWGVHDCNHYEDVGVRCDRAPKFTVRLEANGLLLVSNGGKYRTVCDYHFDVRDARVVCRMLNKSTKGVRVLYHVRGGQRRRIVLNDLDCSGHEKSLSECRHSRWGDIDECSHSWDVGVRCGSRDEYTFDEETNDYN